MRMRIMGLMMLAGMCLMLSKEGSGQLVPDGGVNVKFVPNGQNSFGITAFYPLNYYVKTLPTVSPAGGHKYKIDGTQLTFVLNFYKWNKTDEAYSHYEQIQNIYKIQDMEGGTSYIMFVDIINNCEVQNPADVWTYTDNPLPPGVGTFGFYRPSVPICQPAWFLTNGCLIERVAVTSQGVVP